MCMCFRGAVRSGSQRLPLVALSTGVGCTFQAGIRVHKSPERTICPAPTLEMRWPMTSASKRLEASTGLEFRGPTHVRSIQSICAHTSTTPAAEMPMKIVRSPWTVREALDDRLSHSSASISKLLTLNAAKRLKYSAIILGSRTGPTGLARSTVTHAAATVIQISRRGLLYDCDETLIAGCRNQGA